ncbi:MAG: ATP-binding protein [Chitinophagaceae bacterium]
MKTIIKILFLLLPFTASAQYDPNWGFITAKQADSLRKAIPKEKNDTLLMNAYRTIGFYYGESNLDSGLYFYRQCLDLAQKLNLKIWVSDAFTQIGYCYSYKGNITAANEYFLKSISIAEDKKNENSNWRPWTFSNAKNIYESRIAVLGIAYNGIGALYVQIGDTAKSKEALNEALRLGTLINNGKIQSLVYGNSFFSSDADSIIFYAKKSSEYALSSGYKKFVCADLLQIAQGLYLKAEYDSVAYYLLATIQSARQEDNKRFECMGYYGLILFNGQLHKGDSLIYYANKMLSLADEFKMPDLVRLAYQATSNAYALHNNTDSAFKYLQSYTLLNDSLNNSYIKQLTDYRRFAFNEQQRLTKLNQEKTDSQNKIKLFSIAGGLLAVVFIALILYRNNRKQRQSNNVLQKTLTNLKSTQSQLVQSEKMASLGELTAGIAHEIQNPLNFVNNFSDVSKELLDEMKEAMDKGDSDEAKEIMQDVIANLEKINHHGQRAGDIVKGMLQHSRTSTGQKELTDINELCDEYLRLSYHGLRAKDKSFNAKFETEFDPSLPKINVVPQDIGRVILNLINNAFYATNERKKLNELGYEPIVSVSTKKENDKVIISVKDNGTGIPKNIVDKIFQPFFTTKPTGSGTGLGLSLSYDIVKAHGGELSVRTPSEKVETKEGDGSKFVIIL